MERRELLKLIAAATGMALIGTPTAAFAYSDLPAPESGHIFTDTQVAALDEIAETILPRTKTPGAKDAGAGAFMALYVTDCYSTAEQLTFRHGLEDINTRAGGSFVALSPQARTQLLVTLDNEAKGRQPGKPHYFTMLKQLAILSFFTSKVGATEVLRHVAVPGYYDGAVDYIPGTPAWAPDLYTDVPNIGGA